MADLTVETEEEETPDAIRRMGDLPPAHDPHMKLWRVQRVYQFLDGTLKGVVGLCEGRTPDGAELSATEAAMIAAWERKEPFDANRLIAKPFRCAASVHRRIRREWREALDGYYCHGQWKD